MFGEGIIIKIAKKASFLYTKDSGAIVILMTNDRS